MKRIKELIASVPVEERRKMRTICEKYLPFTYQQALEFIEIRQAYKHYTTSADLLEEFGWKINQGGTILKSLYDMGFLYRGEVVANGARHFEYWRNNGE